LTMILHNVPLLLARLANLFDDDGKGGGGWLNVYIDFSLEKMYLLNIGKTRQTLTNNCLF